MRRSFRITATLALALATAGSGAACMAQRGSIPMAGSRYPSTVCVFGMRGVRIAVDDCDADEGSLDVTLTMGDDMAELRRRAHELIENPNATTLADSVPRPAPLVIPARSVVEDIATGVRIHVTPLSPHDLSALRDEIEERIERAADADQCP